MISSSNVPVTWNFQAMIQENCSNQPPTGAFVFHSSDVNQSHRFDQAINTIHPVIMTTPSISGVVLNQILVNPLTLASQVTKVPTIAILPQVISSPPPTAYSPQPGSFLSILTLSNDRSDINQSPSTSANNLLGDKLSAQPLFSNTNTSPMSSNQVAGLSMISARPSTSEMDPTNLSLKHSSSVEDTPISTQIINNLSSNVPDCHNNNNQPNHDFTPEFDNIQTLPTACFDTSQNTLQDGVNNPMMAISQAESPLSTLDIDHENTCMDFAEYFSDDVSLPLDYLLIDQDLPDLSALDNMGFSESARTQDQFFEQHSERPSLWPAFSKTNPCK